tara:strand:- start:131 stop:439 length:309 start_codon:yes stop_codon:yes gene_type:complete
MLTNHFIKSIDIKRVHKQMFQIDVLYQYLLIHVIKKIYKIKLTVADVKHLNNENSSFNKIIAVIDRQVEEISKKKIYIKQTLKSYPNDLSFWDKLYLNFSRK